MKTLQVFRKLARWSAEGGKVKMPDATPALLNCKRQGLTPSVHRRAV